MSDLKNLPPSIQTSRRHLMRIGAVAGAAILARLAKPAAAAGRGHENDGQTSCFLRGTTIRTAEGDRKIDDLIEGDLLPTVGGGTRPIQWIGCYPFRRGNPAKPCVMDVPPDRVARSALGPDIPNADLY